MSPVARNLLRMALAALTLIAVTAALAGGGHWTFDLTLRPEVARTMLDGEPFGLPQFRAYDAEGRQVLDLGTGFSPQTFDGLVEGAFERPEPAGGTMTLADELARVMQPHGSPVPPLPEADFTLVKYWADWCVPCKDLDGALKEILSRHPGLRVNILSVEADPGKALREAKEADGAMGKPLMIDASSLPEDLRQRLEEGKLTPEDMDRLAKEAEEKSAGREN